MTIKPNKTDVVSFETKIMKQLNASQNLETVAEQEHLSIARISELTTVKRDIIKRFLKGTKINHLDYQKILDTFPNIAPTNNEPVVAISGIDVFGVLTKTGVVRHLYINEQKKFYFLDHLKKAFDIDAIAIKNPVGDSFNICKCVYIKNDEKLNQDIYTPNNVNKEFFIKTEQSCYYGILLQRGNKFQLCNWLTQEPLVWEKDETIVEAYFMFVCISSNWLDAIQKKLRPKVTRVEDIIKDGTIIGYKNL